MAQTYFVTLTKAGEIRQANAEILDFVSKLTHLAVGDGNGEVPIPDREQQTLVREVRRAPINSRSVDPKNPSHVIFEQVIPENIGGWWIREAGLFDEAGVLCAVANCPPTYKPLLAEGSGRTQVIRLVLLVTGTASVELKIDPAVVLATRDYCDTTVSLALTQHEAARHDIDVGQIAFFARDTAPPGYLKANGAHVPRATYAQLFAVIGTRFGAGDGSTTFNVPDLRGEFIRSWDDDRKVDTGRTIGSWQPGGNEDHFHLMPTTTGDNEASEADITALFMDGNGTLPGSVTDVSELPPETRGNNSGLVSGQIFRTYRQSSGGPTAHSEARPRNVAFLACIKH
jgi:phage-related tail fiber protein